MVEFVPLAIAPHYWCWRVCYLPTEVAVPSLVPGICCINLQKLRVVLMCVWYDEKLVDGEPCPCAPSGAAGACCDEQKQSLMLPLCSKQDRAQSKQLAEAQLELCRAQIATKAREWRKGKRSHHTGLSEDQSKCIGQTQKTLLSLYRQEQYAIYTTSSKCM